MMPKTYLQNVITLVLSFAIKLTLCNDGPVIGVLTQDIYWSSFRHYKPSSLSTFNSYVAASYVKAIEASGGRVVPVFNNKSTEYYEEVVSKVNGILIPGGRPMLNTSFGIGRSTVEIFRIAKRINKEKDYFPIIGICKGLELLLIASIDEKNPLVECVSNDVNLPLNLIPEMENKSVLFGPMPEHIRNALLTEPITFNQHKKCIRFENFTSMNLDTFWNPITTNQDNNNLTFISTIEAKDYPFVGLQFHPEKNAYEWSKNYPHSWSAIQSARYFYDWFINECRKNNHDFMNNSALQDKLIYNYPVTYVGKLFERTFEQVYFFND